MTLRTRACHFVLAAGVVLITTGCSDANGGAGGEPMRPGSGSGGSSATGGNGGSSSVTSASSTAVGVGSGGGGDTVGTSGSGGSGGSSGSGGTAGASAAGSDGGNATSPDGGPNPNVPTGNSAGCGKPPTVDTPTKFTKHDVMVTGVDPTFKAPQFGSWSQRNYFVKLPANYNPSKSYAVIFGGGGCGNTDGNAGQTGGFGVLPNDQDQAVLVGMSYIYPQGAGACFADGYSNTPELPYFDAMLAQVEADYCIAKSKVFIAGYSSGAWEAYTLGFARGGVIRGIATAAGGLRTMRPPSSNLPFAALLLTGAGDGTNPITGPTGSAAARDEVLRQNGCVGTDTTDWATFPAGACKQYTGCPAAFPVVWCTPGGGHTDGGAAYKPAIWSFWSSLPDRP